MLWLLRTCAQYPRRGIYARVTRGQGWSSRTVATSESNADFIWSFTCFCIRVSELVGVSFYNVGCNSSISGQKLPHVFGRITPTVTSWINNIVSSVGSSICSNNKVSTPSTPRSIPTTPSGTVIRNPYCSDTCGKSKKRYSCDDRILGGKEACEHEFPWAALLEIDGKSRCGGNLINDR